jgi:cell pole-organizing protein PopZ
MTQAAKAQEPSMEEILASIRRIIADDEGGQAPEEASTNSTAEASEPKPVPAQQGPVAVPSPLSPEPGAVSDAEIDTMLAEFDRSGSETDEPPLPPSQEGSDVLELTEAMESPERTASSFRTIEPSADVMFSERPAASPRPRANESLSALMSDASTAAVTSAFGSLAHTVLMQNARTIDDLVGDMLRPMLKNWLDENLPTIVERLVRAEIERVSRGRG